MNHQKNDCKSNQQLCAQLTKNYAKSFYLASQLLSSPKKEAAFAVYAFCRTSDNIVDQPGKYPQEELLQWRTKLKEAFRTEKSNHPVLDAFVRTCNEYAIPHSLAFQHLDGMQMDLEKNRYETFDELYDYAYKVAAIPGLMMLPIISQTDHAAKEYAVQLGIAMQLTNIIRDIREDLERGKIYLPQEDLRAFGYSEQDLNNAVENESFRKLVAFEINRAQEYYQKSTPGIGLIARDSRLCIVLCKELYHHILLEIKQKKEAVLQKRIVVPNWKKYLITLKNYGKFFFRLGWASS